MATKVIISSGNLNIQVLSKSMEDDAKKIQKEILKQEKLEKFRLKQEKLKNESKDQEGKSKNKSKEKKEKVVFVYDKKIKDGEKKDTSGPLPDAYDPKYVELHWYRWWQLSGFFKPEINASQGIYIFFNLANLIGQLFNFLTNNFF